MVNLIISDWDDVFTFGATEGYIRCYGDAARAVGIELDREELERRVRSKWGQPEEIELLAVLDGESELLEAASKAYKEALFGGTFLSCLSTFDGANDTLKQLCSIAPIALATGVHPQLLREHVLPHFGFDDVFAMVVSVYDLEDPALAKPHPHSAERIMKELGVLPNETVMIGDAKTDMQMAIAAGITPIAVLTGHMTRDDAEKLEVPYILEDVAQAAAIISSL